MKQDDVKQLWKAVPIREKIAAVLQKSIHPETPYVDAEAILDKICYAIKDEIENLEKEKQIGSVFTLELLIDEFFRARPQLIQPQKVMAGFMYPPGWGNFIEYLYKKLQETAEDWRLTIEELRQLQIECRQLQDAAAIPQLRAMGPDTIELRNADGSCSYYRFDSKAWSEIAKPKPE